MELKIKRSTKCSQVCMRYGYHKVVAIVYKYNGFAEQLQGLCIYWEKTMYGGCALASVLASSDMLIPVGKFSSAIGCNSGFSCTSLLIPSRSSKNAWYYEQHYAGCRQRFFLEVRP